MVCRIYTIHLAFIVTFPNDFSRAVVVIVVDCFFFTLLFLLLHSCSISFFFCFFNRFVESANQPIVCLLSVCVLNTFYTVDLPSFQSIHQFKNRKWWCSDDEYFTAIDGFEANQYIAKLTVRDLFSASIIIITIVAALCKINFFM